LKNSSSKDNRPFIPGVSCDPPRKSTKSITYGVLARHREGL
jgi:hypothetical protein